MSMVITYAQARQLTLDRMNQQIANLPQSELNRPRYVVGFQSYSILDMKAQVERGTQVGRTWVMNEAERLNYVVRG